MTDKQRRTSAREVHQASDHRPASLRLNCSTNTSRCSMTQRGVGRNASGEQREQRIPGYDARRRRAAGTKRISTRWLSAAAIRRSMDNECPS